MARDVIWTPWESAGIEHLRLTEDASGALADSFMFALFEGRPVRLRYEIHVDAAWRVREAGVDLWDPEQRRLTLRSDGAGAWSEADGKPLPDLDGCVDIDLTATPFTNTLPIRRLRLAPGRSEVIRVAYIRVPELTVEPAEQRYTLVEQRASGARYRYEGLDTGYRNELEVDEDGLVLDYPGIFRRVTLV